MVKRLVLDIDEDCLPTDGIKCCKLILLVEIWVLFKSCGACKHSKQRSDGARVYVSMATQILK